MSMEIYQKLSQPPKSALRQITGGRLKGKTDINPQWRYKAMTEVFGLCGTGWKYEIKRLWTEPGPKDQVFAFSEIALYVKSDDIWSDPIPGIGGHMLVPLEAGGLYANDEAFKMAVTDALSVAMKMLGMGADIYAGLWDGSKYANKPEAQNVITKQQAQEINKLLAETKSDVPKFLAFMGAETVDTILAKDYQKAKGMIEAKLKRAQASKTATPQREPGSDDDK